MSTHNFRESLARSEEVSEMPFWEEVYRHYFPDFETMMYVKPFGWAQEGGIDRIVLSSGGKQHEIDEKVRFEDYPDVLLEKWSSFEHRTPGWINKDQACDYLAYAFIPSRRCLLFPFPALRRAWINHGQGWETRYGIIPSENEGYTTHCVPVPLDVLMKAVGGSLRVRWGGSEQA